MTRWQPGAGGRLEQAAFELFATQGYDRTTAAEIAAAAGVTERTFFRHFSDKREVLFSGAASLKEEMVAGVGETAEEAAPIAAVEQGVLRALSLLEGGRQRAARRQQIIGSSSELQERELFKLASLSAAVAEVLGQRGCPWPVAVLAADAGISVFKVAFGEWIDEGQDQELTELARQGFARLRQLDQREQGEPG